MSRSLPPVDGFDSALVNTIAVPTRLLVVALEQPDGTVDGRQLYDIADTLGMSAQQVRLCVRRLLAEGFYTQEGRGRQCVLHGTEKPRSLACPELAWATLARAQDAGDAPWDGRWRLHMLTVPEQSRHVRDQLRARLTLLGAANLGGGTYVSAHDLTTELEPLVTSLQAFRYLTTATSTDLTVAGLREPRAIAARLWPLAALNDDYRRLRQRITGPVLAQPKESAAIGRDTATVTALTVLIETARVMDQDPLLPAELLPPDWNGKQVRDDIDQIARQLDPLLGASPPVALRLLRS